MEVHHHTHKTPTKWTHYFWEFFMLFLAVTLGFFVENQREHYVERHRVKQYARSLISDLEKDTSIINLVLFRIKRNIRITDSLANYIRNRPFDKMRNIDLFVLSSIDRYPPYTWSRATIEQIKNSGSLRYFSNDSIIMRISAYDAFVNHMNEDQMADEHMANRAAELRHQLINLDYPKDFTMGLRNDIDSVLKTSYFTELSASDTTPLITNDIKQVRIFLNEKINLRKHLMIRTDLELPELKKDASALIQLLRKEYRLD